jgi:hypothetical protein
MRPATLWAFFLCKGRAQGSLVPDPKGKAETGMSEAMSSREIEDVLLSIKRLVTDDLRPGLKGSAPAGSTSGKLLLTPALRVVHSVSFQTRRETSVLETVVRAVSAGVERQTDVWESETGDLAPMVEAEEALADEFAEEGLTIRERAEAEWEGLRIDAYAEPVAQSAALESVPDDTEDEPAETAQILYFAEAAETGSPPGWAQSEGADAAEDLQSEPWPSATVEPDAAWADQAEAAVMQELEAALPLQRDADEIILNEIEAPEIAVDEAMLREIVRDVLREELQGRLGERITRNIRKLVRAEISRVMASEELL